MLSPLQVEQVMREAGQRRSGTVSNLLLAALDNAYQPPNGKPSSLQKATRRALEEALGDPQLGRSLRGRWRSWPPTVPTGRGERSSTSQASWECRHRRLIGM